MTNTEAVDVIENNPEDYENLVLAVQHLVDNGIIWSLQGAYQRLLSHLVAEGDIKITV